MRWVLLATVSACCGNWIFSSATEPTCRAPGSAPGEDDLPECDVSEEEVLEDIGVIDPALNELEQDNPRLIQIIKEKYLIPPSEEPYNFTSNTLDITGSRNIFS